MSKFRVMVQIAAFAGGLGMLGTTPAVAAASASNREARFAAYQAAHRNPAAQIAKIKAATAAQIAAYAGQTNAAPDVGSAPVIWRTSKRPMLLWDSSYAPEMVVVPAGEFAMGSATTEPNRDAAEGPQHRVRIGAAFAVSKYPVTVEEYARFVADARYDAGNQCYKTEHGTDWKNEVGTNWRKPGFAQGPDSPVVCINWNDAKAYAAWLSKKTGQKYRLLSEAEYEYADRAGTTTAYWWGDDPAESCRRANGSDLALTARYPTVKSTACQDGYTFTSPVGKFAPNAFGLYDTAGNIWSWVEDCWNDTYASVPGDGSAALTGDCTRRLLRGGSWYYYPRNLRSADRYGNATEPRVNMDGFRVARTL